MLYLSNAPLIWKVIQTRVSGEWDWHAEKTLVNNSCLTSLNLLQHALMIWIFLQRIFAQPVNQAS